MTGLRKCWFLARVGFINLVIIAGAAAIAWAQWPVAVQNSGFGSSGYSQGLVGTILLAILMAGIPIIIWAVIVHAGLSWLLMRPNEVEEYKTRKIIESLGGDTLSANDDKSKMPNRVFDD